MCEFGANGGCWRKGMTPNGGLCTQLTASQANWETERKQVGKGEFKESVMSVNEASRAQGQPSLTSLWNTKLAAS